VQSLYRAGYFTHYAEEGAVKSCKFSHEEEVDLCACRTIVSFSEDGDTRLVTLELVTVEFAHFNIQVQSIFRLTEATGEVEIILRVVDSTDPHAEITINEYITACYGTTEYPEDLTGVCLALRGSDQTELIDYAYRCREAGLDGIQAAEVFIPQVDTRLSMWTDTNEAAGYFREGFPFSPMYTIGIKKTIQRKGELRTWLKVEKAS
jgi:hypothetical protein